MNWWTHLFGTSSNPTRRAPLSRPEVTLLEDRSVPSTLIAEFPGAGVWRYLAASGWRQITPADAARLGDADGMAFGAFIGSGLWELDPGSGWFQLTATDVSVLAVS